jgi:AraC family transcriptional regulator, positive regulator of tynA and feaB
MAVVCSTNDVHPRDRVAYWLDGVLRGFIHLSIRTGNGPFQARMRSGSVGDLKIADYEGGPHEAERTGRHISRWECDDIVVNLQLGGRSIHCQDNHQAVMERGGFFLFDSRRPYTASFEDQNQVISIRVPRHSFEARVGSGLRYACRPLNSQGPLASLAFGYFTMISERVDEIEGAAAGRIAEQALDLLALAMSAEGDGGVTLSSPRTVALTLLKAAIEARLHEPQLKPTVAAAAAGISVRYANALLADENSCLERYIITRRLERCRRVLEDPAQAHRMIGDIAFSWGFSDLSHFNRRFKAEFGCAPGEYRRNARRPAAAL